jgi:hypothetical protein
VRVTTEALITFVGSRGSQAVEPGGFEETAFTTATTAFSASVSLGDDVTLSRSAAYDWPKAVIYRRLRALSEQVGTTNIRDTHLCEWEKTLTACGTLHDCTVLYPAPGHILAFVIYRRLRALSEQVGRGFSRA